MRKALVAALAGAAVSLMAANADAAIYVGTVSGVVTFGYDGDGVFGTPGATLTGDSFTETFTYDTATAHNYYTPTFPQFVVYGTLALTVNGVTITGQGVANATYNTLGTTFVSGGNPDPYEPQTPADPSQPFWFQPYIDLIVLSTPSGTSDGLRLSVTSRSLSPTPSLSDFNLASVPEPSAWALLLSGFLALGLALRTRRRAAAVA